MVSIGAEYRELECTPAVFTRWVLVDPHGGPLMSAPIMRCIMSQRLQGRPH